MLLKLVMGCNEVYHGQDLLPDKNSLVRKGDPYSTVQVFKPGLERVFLMCSKAMGRIKVQRKGTSGDKLLFFTLKKF